MSMLKSFLAFLDRYAENIWMTTGLNNENVERNMKVNITPLSDGSFGITDQNGSLVRTYARARDARRGAIRRGFTVNG